MRKQKMILVGLDEKTKETLTNWKKLCGQKTNRIINNALQAYCKEKFEKHNKNALDL